MKEIQQPKKQPELIRKRIIEQAIILASQKGTAGISIQNVATGAGITKGGVFHHFANKQILIEAMIHEIMSHLDHEVEQLIAKDDVEFGKFTRAYIKTAFMSQIGDLVSPWSALAMTMVTDPTFNAILGQWFRTKLDQYNTSDHHRELEFIRLATDGLWLQSITEIIDRETTEHYQNDLIEKTYVKISSSSCVFSKENFYLNHSIICNSPKPLHNSEQSKVKKPILFQ